uniref:OBG-type G domain-containing protein n=1 Tax=Rhizochromulina marina TaxID=1034831 RepID=A0A7S2W3B3_9STRA
MGHLGLLKARIAKYRAELLEGGSSGGAGGGQGFAVARSGDGRVALIGFPSVGKSTLLSTLTDTKSEAAAYEFTTLTCIPGNLIYNGTKIQLLDLPGIIEGAAHGKGRGKEVIAVARTSDLVMMVLDAGKEQVNRHREILENELETVGLRLNKSPPNITIVPKKTGGVKFNTTVPLTHLGDDPERAVRQVLGEYKMHNCDVLCRQDITVDELIDVIMGNRKYVRCLYVYNKIDTITIEEVDRLAREPHSVVISGSTNLNLDYLLERMWDYMGLIRIFTKRRGQPPDLDLPVVLSNQRDGISVQAASAAISKELLVVFNFALVWGRSAKHSPQRVGLAHELQDEDVVQITPKTNTQQKHSKDYAARVQEYNTMVAEKRKARTKAGKKKRMPG